MGSFHNVYIYLNYENKQYDLFLCLKSRALKNLGLNLTQTLSVYATLGKFLYVWAQVSPSAKWNDLIIETSRVNACRALTTIPISNKRSFLYTSHFLSSLFWNKLYIQYIRQDHSLEFTNVIVRLWRNRCGKKVGNKGSVKCRFQPFLFLCNAVLSCSQCGLLVGRMELAQIHMERGGLWGRKDLFPSLRRFCVWLQYRSVWPDGHCQEAGWPRLEWSWQAWFCVNLRVALPWLWLWGTLESFL